MRSKKERPGENQLIHLRAEIRQLYPLMCMTIHITKLNAYRIQCFFIMHTIRQYRKIQCMFTKKEVKNENLSGP